MSAQTAPRPSQSALLASLTSSLTIQSSQRRTSDIAERKAREAEEARKRALVERREKDREEEEKRKQERRKKLEEVRRRDTDRLLGRWKKETSGASAGSTSRGGGGRPPGGGGKRIKRDEDDEEDLAGPDGDQGEKIRDLTEIRAMKDKRRKAALFDDERDRSKKSKSRSSASSSKPFSKPKVSKAITGNIGKNRVMKGLGNPGELKMLTKKKKDQRNIDEIERDYRENQKMGVPTLGGALKAKAEALGKTAGEKKVVVKKIEVGPDGKAIGNDVNGKGKITEGSSVNGNGKRKREESEEEEEDEEEDEDEYESDDLFDERQFPARKRTSEAYPTQSAVSKEIWSILGRGRDRPMRQWDEDSDDMEAGAEDLRREEMRSAALAKREDQEEERRLKALENEKKRRKAALAK